MDLSDFYPDAKALIDSEVRVLDHLRSNTYIKQDQSQLATDAAKYWGRQRAARNNFEFNSYFDVWHAPAQKNRPSIRASRRQRANVRLAVSSLIESDRTGITNVTYCLGVMRIPRLVILRKFHFDVTTGAGRSQPHPRCHLQYCGKMVPHMKEMGCRQSQLEQMHPWLSEPRIFFWPTSLALLIDMALHEFPSSQTEKFRRANEWRYIVRHHEDLLLRPFCEKCVEVIVDKHKKRILADEFYVD